MNNVGLEVVFWTILALYFLTKLGVFNNKRSICDFTRQDYVDLRTCWNTQKDLRKDKSWFLVDDNYENYKLEFIADIEYNSMILYPSHNWHNSYIKEDWFNDEDRITFTGFFEVV